MADETTHIRNMSKEEKAKLINEWRSLIAKGESLESAAKKLGISMLSIGRLA